MTTMEGFTAALNQHRAATEPMDATVGMEGFAAELNLFRREADVGQYF